MKILQEKKCHCDCFSDEIVIFKDNVTRDPAAKKYKRSLNDTQDN